MTSEEIDFSRVHDAAYNPRDELGPSDQEWREIEASLDEFGQVIGMVWNKRTGNLVAGHQRKRIMQHKGRTSGHFTVVDLDHDAEKKLNLILNKVSGRWNAPKLATVLEDLKLARVDLSLLGWNAVELADLLDSTKPKLRRDADHAAPAKPVMPITKPGNVYELTSCDRVHRLMCGESDNADDVARLMAHGSARLIFTDPPYGVTYDNAQRGDGRRPLGEVNNDGLRAEALRAFLTKIFANAKNHAVENAALYTFLASSTHIEFETALRAAGWHVKQQLIWRKHFALSRSDYHWAHEPMLYAVKAGKNCEWFGPRSHTTIHDTSEEDFRRMPKDQMLAILLDCKKATTVWDEPRDNGSDYLHPTQKPTALCGRALRNNTMPGEYVFDPCGGSGSTMIAAELNQRQSFTMDNDPGFVDVMVRRFLETFETSRATRDGEPFRITS